MKDLIEAVLDRGPDLPLRRPLRRTQPGRHGRGRPTAVALRSDGLRRLAGHPVGRAGRRFRGGAAYPQRGRRAVRRRGRRPWRRPGPGGDAAHDGRARSSSSRGATRCTGSAPLRAGAGATSGLLAYDTAPGTLGSDLLRADRYGRTEPFAEPPELWPVTGVSTAVRRGLRRRGCRGGPRQHRARAPSAGRSRRLGSPRWPRRARGTPPSWPA